MRITGIIFVVFMLQSVFSTSAAPGDEVIFRLQEIERRLQGRIVVEAQDSSLLFEASDGRLWIIKADQLVNKTDNDEVAPSLTAAEMEKQLLGELPEGFKVHSTDHFIIAYNTEKSYAKWLGGVYEQLFKGFSQYWERKRKFELDEPKFPLVVIVFSSFEEYSAQVKRELEQDPGSMVAYYNLMTNRVIMFDLTSNFRSAGNALDTDRKIYEILANPNALPMVATVVHEGTHQLMFNMGMQTRFADTPLWVNEGLAMFFETPDMDSPKGWRTIGQVNPLRLANFRQQLGSRVGGGESLKALLTNDMEFRDPQKTLALYAEAWALNYFLLTKHSKEYVAYLKVLSEKKPLMTDTPEQRLKDFETAIGLDLRTLDAEFIEYVQKLR